jgi:hypothetical protein
LLFFFLSHAFSSLGAKLDGRAIRSGTVVLSVRARRCSKQCSFAAVHAGKDTKAEEKNMFAAPYPNTGPKIERGAAEDGGSDE